MLGAVGSRGCPTRTQKPLRAQLHLIFLLMRYGGLRLGGCWPLPPRTALDAITGMLRVPGSNAREILPPVTAMRNIRRILSLPQAAELGFLQFDQSVLRKKLYAVGSRMGLPANAVGPRAIRYSRGLELLELHVPMPLVLKFLGQQDPEQLLAFLNFSDGAARPILHTQVQGKKPTDSACCKAGHWCWAAAVWAGMWRSCWPATVWAAFAWWTLGLCALLGRKGSSPLIHLDLSVPELEPFVWPAPTSPSPRTPR